MPLCGRSERIKHLKARLVRGAGSYTRQTQFYFRRRCLSGLEMITAFNPGQGECHAKRKGQSAGARGKRQSTSLGTTTLASGILNTYYPGTATATDHRTR